MDEKRNKLLKSFAMYDDKTLEEIFAYVTGLVIRNRDFSVYLSEGDHKMLPVIESMTGRKIKTGILSEEDKQLLLRILDASFGTPKRKLMEELLTEICMNDILFEGMCLVISDEEQIYELTEMLGCEDKYDELSSDKCYQARRQYAMKIDSYATAAAGYYGALHCNDLARIIEEYEDFNTGYDLYKREEGGYTDTIFFSPEYFFTYTLKELVATISAEVLVTVDGLVLNGLYEEEYQKELSEYVDFIGAVGNPTEDEVKTFFAIRNNRGYRSLVQEASKYELYIPPKKKLMKYVDSKYVEETKSETKLRRYVKDKYYDRMEARAEEYDDTIDDVLDDFVAEFRIQETEKMPFPDTCEDILRRALHVMNGFGIRVEEGRDSAELADFVRDMLMDSHKWLLHGWTRRESEEHLRKN